MDFLRDTFGLGMPDVIPAVGSTPSGGYSAEYQAVYDQFATKPSAADATAQDTFVRAGLSDAGDWWSDLDRLFIFASHASGADSLLDWIDPTRTATAVLAPTWTIYSGYQGDALTQYINTNYDPSNDGVNFILNDGSYGVYSRTSGTPDGNKYEIGSVNAGGQLNIKTLNAGTSGQLWLNSGNSTTSNIGSSDGSGMHCGDRPDAATQYYFLDGVDESIVSAVASSSIAATDQFVLCRSNVGVPIQFSVREISMAFYGASLGATKQLSLYNAFQSLMTYYGTQV